MTPPRSASKAMMHRKKAAPRPRRSNRPLAAFTLMEVMIAVGALAVLGVAIAAVFQVTGKTVTGGRRISAMNAYANLIEQQMRDDFASLSREGFLVIRHQYPQLNAAGEAEDVPLHTDDLSPRPRRSDEIVFFIKGQFTSAREPLHPQLIPSADAARVYYGHGEGALPTSGNSYWRPEVHDRHIGAGKRLGVNIPGNPNRYAADWTLLRHTTALIPRGDHLTSRGPRNTYPLLQNTPLFTNANGDPRLIDSTIQVGAQPAAFSIFRHLNYMFPTGAINTVRGAITGSPQFTSGLVDIAACSLHEIRAIVCTADDYPVNANANFYDQFRRPGGPAGTFQYSFQRQGVAPGGVERVEKTQAWMEDAFPSELSWAYSANVQRRVRYETVPPNLVGSLSGTWPGGDVEAAYRRADQAMLASWGFLPHCTEFIVEWSSGQTFPPDTNPPQAHYVAGREGELIWHGLNRSPAGQPYVARPFGVDAGPPPANWSRWAGQGTGSRHLIHGVQNTGTFPAQLADHGPLLSYFGYFDPTHNPTAAEPTRQWPWPRHIRVTLSLADPRDPAVEQTFQFVFDIPQQ